MIANRRFPMFAACTAFVLMLPAIVVAQSLPTATTPDPNALSPGEHARQVFVQTLAAFINSHDRAKAQQGFLDAAQIDPSYAPAWFNLGVLSENDKDWTKSKDYFTQYLRIASNGPDAARAKAQLDLLTAYANGAVDPAAAEHAEYDALIERARYFLAGNLFREAIAEAGRAQSSDSSRWEAYALVSLSMAGQHKTDIALKFQAMAVDRAPADKRDQVREALQKAIEPMPVDKQNIPSALVAAATDLSLGKEHGSVLTSGTFAPVSPPLQTADQSGNDQSAGFYYYRIGLALAATGKVDEAISAFSHSLAADPNNSESQYEYGMALARKTTLNGKGVPIPTPGALAALRKYLQLSPEGKHSESAQSAIMRLDTLSPGTLGPR